MSFLWFALYAQWMTIVPIILPNQVAGLLGSRGTREEAVTGIIIAAGAVVPLLVTPLAGALSDRLRTRRGRRRPFLISGMLGSSLALVCLGLFGSGSIADGCAAPTTPTSTHAGSVLLLYALAFLHLQFWWNWAAGPYAGLIPDVAQPADRARASGWMNVMTILGTIAGNLLVAAFYPIWGVRPVIGAFVAINLTALLVTLRIREPPAPGDRRRLTVRAFVRSFVIDPRDHPNFYWVLVTRLFSGMGLWSILAFLLFYMQSVMGLTCTEATRRLPLMLGAGACLAVPASVVGVRLADRRGAVPVVQVTSWIMAAAALCFVLLAMSRQVVLLAPVVLVFAVASGAYGATDWLLALKVLPNGREAGKDMGIWHISMVLPQIVGPLTLGWLISALRAAASAQLAYAVAFGIAALWFALAAVLVARIRLPGSDLVIG